MSELREVIGALQSEAEFGAAVGELGAAGIDRARGHCRVVRRRRCRPGNDWRSVRADVAGDVVRARVESDPKWRHRVDRSPRPRRAVRGRHRYYAPVQRSRRLRLTISVATSLAHMLLGDDTP